MLRFFHQQMYFYLTYTILIIKIYIKTPFHSYSYMFRSVRTITRDSILSLAKVTFLWIQSVKLRRYNYRSIVAACVSGYGVCAAWRARHAAHTP